MIIKTTTSLLKNIKNLENFFEKNSNITVLTNKNKVVWALISEKMWSYLYKTWMIEKFEKELNWDFSLWTSNLKTENVIEDSWDSWDSDDFEEFDKQPKKMTSKEEAEAIFT